MLSTLFLSILHTRNCCFEGGIYNNFSLVLNLMERGHDRFDWLLNFQQIDVSISDSHSIQLFNWHEGEMKREFNRYTYISTNCTDWHWQREK